MGEDTAAGAGGGTAAAVEAGAGAVRGGQGQIPIGDNGADEDIGAINRVNQQAVVPRICSGRV